jgi:hypothetical protein
MANILTKTGITTGGTVLPGHVTQSIDALTGTLAYDITISGSLTLTGSIASLNGFTGSMLGTSSWANNAIASTTAVTASYVLNAISASFSTTASFVRNAISASYILNGVSSSFASTASYIQNAVSASYVLNAVNSTNSTITQKLSSEYKPSGSNFINGNLGMLAGSTTLSSGISTIFTPTELTGKRFQTEFWVTTTLASGSTTPGPNTVFYVESPSLGQFRIREAGGAISNDDVCFTVMYLKP